MGKDVDYVFNDDGSLRTLILKDHQPAPILPTEPEKAEPGEVERLRRDVMVRVLPDYRASVGPALDAFEAAIRTEERRLWNRCTHGILLTIECAFCRRDAAFGPAQEEK